MIFRRVVAPQLLPAWLAGLLLVALYVFGDFGVVSLMRFETFSYAIFMQYSAAYDRVYAACLALMLMSVTGAVLFFEARILRDVVLERAASGSARVARPFALGAWAWGARIFVGAVLLVSVVLPVGMITYWLAAGSGGVTVVEVARSLLDSLRSALPAAITAVAIAVPVAVLAGRYPARFSRLAERASWVGYATPPLALALGLIFFSLRAAPGLYQTMWLLVAALAIHFLAQAIGPVRTALATAGRRLEEASRSLGRGRFATFRTVSFPLLRPGIAAGATLVFLSCLKELPLTFLLAPLDFRPLALSVYSYATEAMFAEAAPYALAVVAAASVGAGLLLRISPRERDR